MNYVVRALGVADVDEFRRVRLDALRLHPEAFIASYEDECVLDRVQFAERLATPGLTRFGAFAHEEMVGLVGLQVPSGTKVRHKAHLFSMYVANGHRRTGRAEGAIALQAPLTARLAQLLHSALARLLLVVAATNVAEHRVSVAAVNRPGVSGDSSEEMD